MLETATNPDIFYPSEDDEPLAETQLHALAILTIFNVLSLFLQGKPVVLFVDQFLYYREGDPSARVAPDVMLVFGIPQQFYDNYKVWEYGQVPAVIFEVTSTSTRENDQGYKKELYERLGVKEYWLFDPKGEWIEEQLRGYRLGKDGRYEIIEDRCSEVLQLRLQPCDYVLNFYRLDNNEKLLTPEELLATSQAALERAKQAEAEVQEVQAIAEAERQRAELERQRAEEERQRAEAEKRRAEEEQRRAEAEKLRAEEEQRRAEVEKRRAEEEQRRAEAEKLRAEEERRRADRLAQKLRELGISPE